MLEKLGFLKEFVDGLKQYNTADTKKYLHEQVRKRIVVPVNKPRFNVEIDLKNSIKYKGVVVHHTWSQDRPMESDTEREIRYQTSYRMDGEIIAAPLMAAPAEGVATVKTHGRYYLKSDVDKYNNLKANGKGKKFEMPWITGGYNLMIEHVNNKAILNYVRPFNMSGAHAGVHVGGSVNRYFNDWYVGISTIGNFDKAEPPIDAWSLNLMVVRDLMDKFKFPATEVIGHREVYARVGVPVEKTCPGSKWDMDKFRREL